MSIIIKTDELNFLIYTYLLEQGLQHTAFSLFNEVKLDKTKYQDDVKPGHLINLLEKALIFQQLQDHVQMSQYFECKVPTQLITKHICNFTEKKLQDKREQTRERELIVSNAILRNQEIVSIYLYKMAKSNSTLDINVNINAYPIEEITLMDWNSHRQMLATYVCSQNCVKLYNREMQLQQILGAVIAESFQRVHQMQFDRASGNYLMLLFENGSVVLSDLSGQVIKMFNVKNACTIRGIRWNLNWPNVVGLLFERDVEIIDVFKCMTMRQLEGCSYFEWRFYDQFIVMDSNYFVSLYQIDQEKASLVLKADLDTSLVEFNKSKTLLATFSSPLNNIKVWTLVSDQYVFEITDDQKILQFAWCSSLSANYLITLTTQLNIWDVEFGTLKTSHSLSLLNPNMFSLDLIADAPHIALLTNDAVYLYDLANRKRRVINKLNPQKITRINDDEVLIQYEHALAIYNIKTEQ